MSRPMTSYSPVLPCKFAIVGICLLISMLMGACSSSDKNDAGNPAPQATSAVDPLMEAVHLHDTGIALFAAGLGSEDVAALMQGISLLEEATLAGPDNNAYWIDLADAYLSSGLAVFYPAAIDIYWMLYNEDKSQPEALLSRLVAAYQNVGNQRAAFETAVLQLDRAKDTTDVAALQLTLLAFAQGRTQEAAEILVKRAGKIKNPAPLLYLAASLKDLDGDSAAALKLSDQALAKLRNNPQMTRLVEDLRGGLNP